MHLLASHMPSGLPAILSTGLAMVLLLSLFARSGRSTTARHGRQTGLYRILAAAVLMGIAAIPQPHLGLQLPSQPFQTADGAITRLSDLKGRLVIVNLWATWCAPCLREMPVLRNAQGTLPQNAFVFANQGESPASVLGYLSRTHASAGNVILDEEKKLAKMAGSAVIPTTLFFDHEGKLRLVKRGAFSESSFRDALASFSH
jgi:thiol-disulfide isomerase/thioredoxin